MRMKGRTFATTSFLLLYGAKILLNTAALSLKRGHRYSLCGKKGTGKPTLMPPSPMAKSRASLLPMRSTPSMSSINGSEEDASVPVHPDQ